MSRRPVGTGRWFRFMRERRKAPMTDEEITRSLLEIDGAVRCGLHSGIPPCCIRFFVTRWMWSFAPAENMSRLHVPTGPFAAAHRDRIDEASGAGWSYVPCPACLREGRAAPDVRPCPPGSQCGGDGRW